MIKQLLVILALASAFLVACENAPAPTFSPAARLEPGTDTPAPTVGVTRVRLTATKQATDTPVPTGTPEPSKTPIPTLTRAPSTEAVAAFLGELEMSDKVIDYLDEIRAKYSAYLEALEAYLVYVAALSTITQRDIDELSTLADAASKASRDLAAVEAPEGLETLHNLISQSTNECNVQLPAFVSRMQSALDAGAGNLNLYYDCQEPFLAVGESLLPFWEVVEQRRAGEPASVAATIAPLPTQPAPTQAPLPTAPLPTSPPVPSATAPPTNTPVPPSPTQPVPTQPPSPAATPGNCHPSYPDNCIPPPPPDLDCGDIPYRRFRVLPPDPHRFDADNNGIGCES